MAQNFLKPQLAHVPVRVAVVFELANVRYDRAHESLTCCSRLRGDRTPTLTTLLASATRRPMGPCQPTTRTGTSPWSVLWWFADAPDGIH
jgi:hypothetical protein